MTSGLVNASFSLPEGQAVKMIFFAPYEMYFLSEKMKSMLQNKQSDQFDTLRQTHLWSVVFVVNAFFQIPSSSFRLVERG